MKKIIIPIIMLLILVGIVSAVTVTLDPQSILANNTYQTSTSITYNVNATGNQSTYYCWLWTTENGSTKAGGFWNPVTSFPVENNTATNFTVRADVFEGKGSANYTWNIRCNGSTDKAGNASTNSSEWSTDGNHTFGVDATDPVVTINTPSSNGAWFTNGTNVQIGLTVIDVNPNLCNFSSSLNTSASINTTGIYNQSFNVTYYTNNTAFNISQLNAGLTSLYYDWGDNNTDDYIWSYVCNDDAGNSVSLGSNYTFYVDSTAPSAFDFNTSLWRTDNRLLFNATNSTDYTPQVGWNITTELNFSRYNVCFYNDSYADTDATCVNVTSKTTLVANITTLTANEMYKIMITAYDLAGNAINMSTTNYQYGTDSTNRALLAGWNIVGNVGNDFTLSHILNWTGATTASIWNSTHQFTSHVSGGSSGTTVVKDGDPVLIYVGTATTFSDLIWNETAMNETAHNITNQTESDWNLIMMRDADDDKTFQDIDSYLNCERLGAGCSSGLNNVSHVTYFSSYNNSATAGSKYMPYVANWSINNGTSLTYGDSIWIYLDNSSVTNITINWTAV